MVTTVDINAKRYAYKLEREERRAHVSKFIEVDYSPLNEVPPIRLKFKVGGGVSMNSEYIVQGGPDDGKIVILRKWHPPEYLHHLPSHEGYASRPSFFYYGKLHIATVMYVISYLEADRDESMRNEIMSMYDNILN